GVWGWIGVVPLATGIFNFCPAYKLLGMNTCKLK
ncbi:MAG: YgaP family membrane protein, partial [Pseudomonadota bacterium]